MGSAHTHLTCPMETDNVCTTNMAMRQAQVDLFDRVQRLVNGGKTGGGEALLKA